MDISFNLFNATELLKITKMPSVMTVALPNNELLRDFEPDWVQWFEEHCIPISFAAGDHMIEGGHSAAGLYVLLEGDVVVYGSGGDLMARVPSGSVVGEMALVDGGLRSADVIAETDVSALLMTKHQFQAIGRSRPEIALQVMTNLCQIMSTRVRHLHQLLR